MLIFEEEIRTKARQRERRKYGEVEKNIKRSKQSGLTEGGRGREGGTEGEVEVKRQ